MTSDSDNFGGIVLKDFSNVIDWGRDKGILAKGTPIAQADKIVEEANEVRDAVEALDQADTGEQYEQLLGDVELEVGDNLVTLILECKLLGLDLNRCLSAAHNKNMGRSGEMIDGQFVRNRS